MKAVDLMIEAVKPRGKPPEAAAEEAPEGDESEAGLDAATDEFLAAVQEGDAAGTKSALKAFVDQYLSSRDD